MFYSITPSVYVSGPFGTFRVVWPVSPVRTRRARLSQQRDASWWLPGTRDFYVTKTTCFRLRVGLARFGSCGPFPREGRVGPVYVYGDFESTLFCNIKRHVVGLGSVRPVSVRAASFPTKACRARLFQNRVTSLHMPGMWDAGLYKVSRVGFGSVCPVSGPVARFIDLAPLRPYRHDTWRGLCYNINIWHRDQVPSLVLVGRHPGDT
jgi:hypothetical protein